MYVCLCHGVTGAEVCDAVARGAQTSKHVAMACGAGSDCGRCKRTIRAIIAEQTGPDAAARTAVGIPGIGGRTDRRGEPAA
ncbi:MAG TPA: (2Fe-2S)-binding protein [Aldersonia sp.]